MAVRVLKCADRGCVIFVGNDEATLRRVGQSRKGGGGEQSRRSNPLPVGKGEHGAWEALFVSHETPKRASCRRVIRRDSDMKIENAADFGRAFSVSHETLEKLELYERLLLQWQKAVNLVAPATLPQIWQRHFADSAQLRALASQAKTWVDLGSGGGFPGLAIAIMIANQKECYVHLIESNSRKCAFLSEVARRTGAPARVHNMRIADAASSGVAPIADVVTARALAPLDALLELALPFFGNASAGLFLKGREAGVEIADARKRWTFDLKVHPSISDAQGQIVEIRKPMLIQGGEQ